MAFVVVTTQDAYDNGEHYDEAMQRASDSGYTDCVAFDENDPAGRLMARLRAGTAVAVDAARTPKEGEHCADAPDNTQRWYDQEHVEGRLFGLVDAARRALGVTTPAEADALVDAFAVEA